MEHDAPPHRYRRPWADLDAGLLSHIADRCTTLRDYAFFRAACTAWRSPLPPPTSRPLAPVLPRAGGTAFRQPLSFAAWGLLAKERWSPLHGLRQPPGRAFATDYRCVGARDGWVAVAAACLFYSVTSVCLFNPVTGDQIHLDDSMQAQDRHGPDGGAHKVVFSPSPTPCDFAAVSICGPKRLAVQRSCDSKGSTFILVIDTDRFMHGAVLADVAYCDNGTAYCLTAHGGVYVLHLNRRHRRGCSVKPVGVKPLVAGTVVFPAPYDTISRFTDAKSLVLCDGVLYQIWRRPRGAGSVDTLTGEGRQQVIRILEGSVFVLRYDPGRWPCWSEAKDLGGYAVFIGKNDAVAARVDDRVTGFRGDCVYYWDRRADGDYEAVVFDMATGRSERWQPVDGRVWSPLWYFLPAARKHDEATTSVEDTGVEASVPDTA